MKNTPLVSVVMVVKNGESYLKDAIDSVLKQTYSNYEIILIDGKSIDKTAQIAQSYSQIRYYLQENTGIAIAYNQGIDLAEGELIAFLSCDDLWTPDKLQSQVEYMVEHPNVEYTVAQVRFFLEKGHSPPPTFRMDLLKGNHIGKIMETLVARKSLFDKIGKLNPKFKTAEDVDWFARASDAQIPMAIIPKVLLHKRVHNVNLSLNSSNNTENLLKIIRKSIQRKKNS